MAKIEYKRGKLENLNDKNVPVEDGSIIIGYDKDSNKAEMYVDIGDNRYPVNSIKVDQGYSPKSQNAQSGIAVAEAINPIFKYLDYTIDDNGVSAGSCDTSISGAHTLPETVEGYPWEKIPSFENCTNLTSITIPDGVAGYLDNGRFYGCTSLETVYIGAGITIMLYGIFQNCSSLKTITIADTLNEMRGMVFEGCTSLTDIYYGGSQESWESVINEYDNAKDLINVTIHYNQAPAKKADVSEKPGEITLEGGIIFGDYETNQALAPNSSAFGQNNIAGSNAFKILAVDEINLTMTLNSVEGLVVGMVCSCQYNNIHDIFGAITTIDVGNNTITLDALPSDTFKESNTNTLWIPTNPELGDGETIIGTGAFAAGHNCKANQVSSFVLGYNSIAASKYSFVAGHTNTGGFASLVGGSQNTIGGTRNFGANRENTILTPVENSAVFGFKNKILSGTNQFAIGNNNTISGESNSNFIAGGNNKITNGWNNFVVGRNNTNSGWNDIVCGENNTNAGYSNIIAGNTNTSSGINSVVSGSTNKLYSGENNLVTGYGNNVYATRCLISGLNNAVGTQDTPIENAIIGGAYAKVDSTTAFAIGNGANANNPKNAITVNKDGNMTLNGSLNINEERFFANGDNSTSLRLKVSSKSDPTQEIFSVRHYSGAYNASTTVMGRFLVKHHDKNMLYISEDTAGPLVESRRMFLWDTVDSYKNETKSPDSRAVNVGYLNHRLNEEVTKLDAKLSTVYKYKGSLEHVSQLDSIENPDTGDVYNVRWDGYNEGNNYAWTGTEWEALGSTIDLNNYADKSFVADYVSGYATENWVNENYLHCSERLSIASDGAFMAETHLEPRFISIEADMDTLSYKISNLPPIEDTYNPTSENAQSGKAVAEALTQFTQSSILNDVIMSYQFADKSFVDNHITFRLEEGEYVNKEGLRFTTTGFTNGERLFMCEANNSEFIATEPIESLTIDIGKHEQDYENRENHNYINSVLFTVADSENVSITIFDGDTNEEPKYIGTPPDFKAGETWELNIKNGIVAAGKVGA